MTPTLILDDVPISMPPFTIGKGSIEYTIGRKGKSVSFRLQNLNPLTQEIELEGIEVDIYSTKQKALSSIYGYRGLGS